jgi:hypothetical protein
VCVWVDSYLYFTSIRFTLYIYIYEENDKPSISSCLLLLVYDTSIGVGSSFFCFVQQCDDWTGKSAVPSELGRIMKESIIAALYLLLLLLYHIQYGTDCCQWLVVEPHGWIDSIHSFNSFPPNNFPDVLYIRASVLCYCTTHE